MSYRVLLVAGVLAASVSGYCAAETIAIDGGIAVKESPVPTPTRGMTMEQVAGKFGNPTAKIPAVGKPPISRWEYSGFTVFFEYNHVIHAVVTEASAAAAAQAPVAG
jgi:hypothetical protein